MAAFAHYFAKGEGEGEEGDGGAGEDDEEVYGDYVGEGAEEEHSGGHHEAGNHGKNAENPAHVFRFNFGLQQHGGGGVVKRYTQAGNGHDAEVEPEIFQQAERDAFEAEQKTGEGHRIDAVLKAAPQTDDDAAGHHPYRKTDFYGGEPPNFRAIIPGCLQRR